MKVSEAISLRRSIRKFTGQQLTGDEVNHLLEAARLAPSGLNAQPWRFKVVLDKNDITWLAREALKGQRWAAGATAMFICCADLSRYLEDSRASMRLLKDSNVLPPEMMAGIEELIKNTQEAPAEILRSAAAFNCAIAVTQMMLRAVELGLGTCWIGMFEEEKIKDRFVIPKDLAVVSLLAAGRPAEAPDPRPRKSLKEIVL